MYSQNLWPLWSSLLLFSCWLFFSSVVLCAADELARKYLSTIHQCKNQMHTKCIQTSFSPYLPVYKMEWLTRIFEKFLLTAIHLSLILVNSMIIILSFNWPIHKSTKFWYSMMKTPVPTWSSKLNSVEPTHYLKGELLYNSRGISVHAFEVS